MGRMSYFKCYPSDFLHGTATLNDEQCALYVRLFMLMYDQGGSVPNDPQKLKHHVHKRPQDIRRVIAQLVTMGKLRVDDEGRLRNGRVDEMTEQWGKRWPRNESPSERPNGTSAEAKAMRVLRARRSHNARLTRIQKPYT